MQIAMMALARWTDGVKCFGDQSCSVEAFPSCDFWLTGKGKWQRRVRNKWVTCRLTANQRRWSR